jgi:hypothetical protein
VLESLRVAAFHPTTGARLDDAVATAAGRPLSLDDGAFVYRPEAPEEALARYVIDVSHPAYGRAARRHVVAPRAFGAVPEAKVAGRRIEWKSPAWANFARVFVELGGGRRIYDRAARSPLELADLEPGALVRVQVGRVDVQHGGDVTVACGESSLRVPWAREGIAPPSLPPPSPPPP